jgi:hypothetical protein
MVNCLEDPYEQAKLVCKNRKEGLCIITGVTGAINSYLLARMLSIFMLLERLVDSIHPPMIWLEGFLMEISS